MTNEKVGKPAAVLASLLLFATPSLGAQSDEAEGEASLADDARAVIAETEFRYAYPERVPEGWTSLFAGLAAEAPTIDSRADLLNFMEQVLHRLCDHHAITGPSSAASPAVIPSYADLWIETDQQGFRITQVRRNSPAARGDVRPGDQLIAVGGVPVEALIGTFWEGAAPQNADCPAYAARVLAAGPRNGDRRLEIGRGHDRFEVVLESLYEWGRGQTTEAITVHELDQGIWQLVFNDRLGDSATIDAIDRIMSDAPRGTSFVLDLRNTPSGGNTSVARAVLGYFTVRVQPYQRHALPVEGRMTGVERSWIEEVSPRGDQSGPPRRAIVLVGRWTGSMGEGMAIGLDALGHDVLGSSMAGLLGAIYDVRLSGSGWVFKLPTERLSHVDGLAREDFVPENLAESGYTGPGEGDPLLEAAVERLRGAR